MTDTAATNYVDRFRLDGQVAVITGAGRGIGEGIALAVAAAGADVVLTARRAHEIEAVAETIRTTTGRRAVTIAGDMTDGEFIDRLADEAKAEMGRVSLWVSNAGGADDRTPRDLSEMPDRQWDYQIALNLTAVFAGARAATRVIDDGGSIINISSGAALKGSPKNGVSPGPVPTEVFMEFFGATDADLPKLAKQWGIPLGRLGTPDDVASAVVYLASPAASWITGQTLLVNGGNR
jgi:NAD(P)-dependent dehydrogenase (short-subunit alcohol dehydrogenase family)